MAAEAEPLVGVATYEVTLTSELLDGPFVAVVMSTSPARAENRIRLTAMHSYRCAELMQADAKAVFLHDGPPTDDD